MRTVLCLSALAFVACGSGTPFPNFVGTWVYNSGSTITFMCPMNTTTVDLRGNLEVLHGVSADVVVLDPNGCDVTYTVKDNTASATGNLICTHPAMIGSITVSETDTVTSASLTTTDGKTMTANGTSTAVFSAMAG